MGPQWRVLTIVGFSAFGKHAGNIVPIMGVVLGSFDALLGLQRPVPAGHAVQDYPWLPSLATSAGPPTACWRGFPPLAVAHAGGGAELYNNGFSGGLLAIILYPTICAIARHRKPGPRRSTSTTWARRAGDPASSAGHDRGGGLRERPGWKKKMDFPYRTSLQSGMGSI